MNHKASLLSGLVGAAFAASAVLTPLTAVADTSFSANTLPAGYTLAEGHAEGKCGEGKCGEGKKDHKKGEGKCGEGKCGEGKKDSEGKCGEGKCGTDKKEAAKDSPTEK
jgi:uncharacterized low-complexity protein